MSLPWEHQTAVDPRTGQHTPPQPYQPPPPPPQYQQPQYQPQPQQYQQPQYQPDIPVAQSMGSVIQQAVNDALQENARHAAANATRAMQKKAKPHGLMEIDGSETVEEAFQSGAVTTMTFVRGIALDIGVAIVAAFATIADGPNFSAFDAELWKTIVPALVIKTVVQTGISFAMKAKYTK